MGKVVQVKPNFDSVALPPSNLPFRSGKSTTLTDAEYAALSASTTRAITVTDASVADPTRTTPGTGGTTGSGAGNTVYRHGPPTDASAYPVGTFVIDIDDSNHAYEITA